MDISCIAPSIVNISTTSLLKSSIYLWFRFRITKPNTVTATNNANPPPVPYIRTVNKKDKENDQMRVMTTNQQISQKEDLTSQFPFEAMSFKYCVIVLDRQGFFDITETVVHTVHSIKSVA